MLTQEFAEEKIDILSGWLDSASEIAQQGESTQAEAERLIGAMTDEEATAFWRLFLRAEDILMNVGQKQMASFDADLEYEEMRGVAAFVWARTIIDYDPERSDLAGYLISASRPHWRRYLRSISPSDRTTQRRRIGRLLRQLRIRKRTHEGRGPTLEEKVDYVRKRNVWARGKAEGQLAKVIREVEREKPPDSLDDKIGDEEGDRTLHELLPSPSQLSIDTEQVARLIAQATRREDLLDALLGEEPGGAFGKQKARQIYLERESRYAGPKRIAWECQTSPYIVAQVENIYDLDLTIEDARRYGLAQGYISEEKEDPQEVAGGENSSEQSADEEDLQEEGSPGKLTEEEVVEICRRYEEEDVTYAELAEDYPVSDATIGDIVRGETHQHVDRPEPDTRPLSPEQVVEICRRYKEEDISYSELSEDYPASDGVIGCIVRGETYTDIDRPDLGPEK